MYTIRNRQLAAIGEGIFQERLERYLLERHSEAVAAIPRGELRPMIAAGIARARSRGITTQAGIGMFVGLMFRIAPNFDEYPPIRAELLKPQGTPDERVLALVDNLAARHWKGAMRRYDPNAWTASPREGDG